MLQDRVGQQEKVGVGALPSIHHISQDEREGESEGKDDSTSPFPGFLITWKGELLLYTVPPTYSWVEVLPGDRVVGYIGWWRMQLPTGETE